MTNLERGPISLQTKMAFLLVLYFAGLYGIARLVGSFTGMQQEALYVGFAFAFLTLLNLGGPAVFERALKVRWVDAAEEPRLTALTERLAARCDLPNPRVGISALDGANAFAFGRTKRDGRICLTHDMVSQVNDEELEAVIGHELSHIKNWDVTIMALMSVLPVLSQALLSVPQAIMQTTGWLPARLLFVAIAVFVTPLVWLAWLILIPVNWFSTLLLNYGSRVRELNADRDAVEMGVPAYRLASALYKVATSEPDLSERQLVKARPLLLATWASARDEQAFLRYVDVDRSGDISYDELANLRGSKPRTTLQQRVAELFSSHPLLEVRFHRLAELT